MSAWAADYPIKVDCPGWSADSAAQVEARIRTTLLVDQLDVRQIGIACEADGAIVVSVEAASDSTQVPVARRSERVEDDVVGTVEAALRQLTPAPAASEAPAPTSQPPPQKAPPPAPPLADPRLEATPASASRATQVTELSVTPAVELWGSAVALGADAGMSAGSERFRHGLVLHGRRPVSEPSAFDVNEWGAAIVLSLTSPGPAGLRAAVSVGASIVTTSPAAHVTAASPTLRATGSVDVRLARPFWLGAFALSPELGVRIFSGRRNVLVDQVEQLALPALVPELGLSFIYRIE